MWPKIRRVEGRSEGLWEDTWFAEPIFDNGFKPRFSYLMGSLRAEIVGRKSKEKGNMVN